MTKQPPIFPATGGGGTYWTTWP